MGVKAVGIYSISGLSKSYGLVSQNKNPYKSLKLNKRHSSEIRYSCSKIKGKQFLVPMFLDLCLLDLILMLYEFKELP